MADLGKAYVQIIPKAEGITSKMNSLLGGAGKSAGSKAGKEAGDAAGLKLLSSMKKALTAAAIGTPIVAGIKTALTVKPATPASAVFPYLDMLDMVLVMTVEPGFGGQKFMADMMPKVTEIREEITRRGLEVSIEVDGGINAETAEIAAKAGADIAVMGSAFFGHENPAALAEIVHGF